MPPRAEVPRDYSAAGGLKVMMKGSGMLNDVIFKIVFGQEDSVALLQRLINALLGLEGNERIAALTIMNPQLDKHSLTDKGVILDIRACDGSRTAIQRRSTDHA